MGRNLAIPIRFATGLCPVLLAALTISFLACGWREKLNQPTEPYQSLRDLDYTSWQRLAKEKIYFGHQSVGADIINGIRDLEKAYPRLRLNIVRNSNPATVAGPAFVESLVGTNGDPGSKTASFLAVLDGGMGSHGGIAMYKYCFVDMEPDTDVVKMFDQYKAAADLVSAKYPRVTQVHITMPLTTDGGPLKAFAKWLLAKPSARDLNRKRNRFNDLLREEYRGREPIFDLARVESTRLDGSRVFFDSGGSAIYSLAPEFTSDGGHLNELGRRVVAEQLLITLARL